MLVCQRVHTHFCWWPTCSSSPRFSLVLLGSFQSGAFNRLRRLVSLLLDGNWGLDTIPADMLYPTTVAWRRRWCNSGNMDKQPIKRRETSETKNTWNNYVENIGKWWTTDVCVYLIHIILKCKWEYDIWIYFWRIQWAYFFGYREWGSLKMEYVLSQRPCWAGQCCEKKSEPCLNDWVNPWLDTNFWSFLLWMLKCTFALW